MGNSFEEKSLVLEIGFLDGCIECKQVRRYTVLSKNYTNVCKAESNFFYKNLYFDYGSHRIENLENKCLKVPEFSYRKHENIKKPDKIRISQTSDDFCVDCQKSRRILKIKSFIMYDELDKFKKIIFGSDIDRNVKSNTCVWKKGNLVNKAKPHLNEGYRLSKLEHVVVIDNNITSIKTKVNNFNTEYRRDVVSKTENEVLTKTIEIEPSEIEPSVLTSSVSKSESNNSQSWLESILTAVIWKDNTPTVTTLDLTTNNFTNNEIKHVAKKKSHRDYRQWYQSFLNHFRLKCSSREPRTNEIKNEKLEGNMIAKDTQSVISFTGEALEETVRKESYRDYQHWYNTFISYFRIKCLSKELADNKVENEKTKGSVISKHAQTVINITDDSVKESLGKESSKDYQHWYSSFLNYFNLRCMLKKPEKIEANKKIVETEFARENQTVEVNLTEITSNTGGNTDADSLYESWYQIFLKNFNQTGKTLLSKKETLKFSNATVRPYTKNITDFIIPESIATKHQILTDDYKPLYNPIYDHTMNYIFAVPHILSSLIAKNETTLRSKRFYLNQFIQEQKGNVSKLFGRRKLGGKGKYKFSYENWIKGSN